MDVRKWLKEQENLVSLSYLTSCYFFTIQLFSYVFRILGFLIKKIWICGFCVICTVESCKLFLQWLLNENGEKKNTKERKKWNLFWMSFAKDKLLMIPITIAIKINNLSAGYLWVDIGESETWWKIWTILWNWSILFICYTF